MVELKLRPDLEQAVVKAVDIEPVAQRGLEIAIEHAPFDPESEGPHLRDSLRLEKLPNGGWRIVADSGHAGFVEFGTEDTEAQPFLGIVPDVLGLKRT